MGCAGGGTATGEGAARASADMEEGAARGRAGRRRRAPEHAKEDGEQEEDSGRWRICAVPAAAVVAGIISSAAGRAGRRLSACVGARARGKGSGAVPYLTMHCFLLFSFVEFSSCSFFFCGEIFFTFEPYFF